LSDRRYLTVKEYADLMRISTATVYRLVRTKQIIFVRQGRQIRIPAD